jgi:uncharacterized protein involved in exopolysaccharide biosynthesis
MDDEIDLKPYLVSALRAWRIIVLVTLLAGGIVMVISFLMPRKYAATATLIITRRRSELTLDDRFQTTIDRVAGTDTQTQAILLLAESDATAQAVLDAFGDEIPQKDNLEAFKQTVKASSEGDAILITARAPSQELAAKIANLWAQKTVEQVNQAYSGQEPLTEIGDEIISAESKYQTSQTAYETFLQTNQIATLNRQIETQTQIRDALQGQLNSLVTLNITTQVGLVQGLASSYLTKLLDQRRLVFSEQTKRVEEKYVYYYDRQSSLERLIIQAQALKDILKNGSLSDPALAGDALAVMIARARAFGVGGGDITLQVDASTLSALTGTPSSYQTDLDRIITSAQSELDSTKAILSDLEAQMLTNSAILFPPLPAANDPLFQAGVTQMDAVLNLETPGELILDYQSSPLFIRLTAVSTLIQTLQAELEGEQATLRELTSDRDLTWTTYQALLRRQTELATSAQVNNSITFASQAIPSAQPVARGTVSKTATAAGAAFALCLMIIWGRQWWQSLDISTASPK